MSEGIYYQESLTLNLLRRLKQAVSAAKARVGLPASTPTLDLIETRIASLMERIKLPITSPAPAPEEEEEATETQVLPPEALPEEEELGIESR